ncbi:MAG TPA: class I SAM-dependent methyltransferase [Terracidiphilus sp.]|jgi:hypothetical protein
MSFMTRLADSRPKDSFANCLRRKRFRVFNALTEASPRPLRVLDVGGTNLFWEQAGWAGRADVSITLINLFQQTRQHANITPLIGDATDLSQFAELSFDIAFSNSVIEHLGCLESQKRMAAEMMRVASSLWVQTPNFWFPIEPHFCIPGWQWMPVSCRVALLRKVRCGWLGPCSTDLEAQRIVESVRLMTSKELRVLFPGSRIIAEWFGGLIKSWIVLRGLPR